MSVFSQLFSLSDEQAMLRVQKQNDARAFGLLVRRWETRIQRLCARLTGDMHTGEDLAQEVFMRVFANRNDYRHEARFGTYLRRIAVNACYDQQRYLKRRPECQISHNDNQQDCLQSPANLPDMMAVEKENAELVRGALFQLPQSYRDVIILRHYEGLKFREIADVLDVPPGTVKSRMAEALNKLNRLLKPILNIETPVPSDSQDGSELNPKEDLL